MAGIKDVAERAGVAVSTVSYVISGKRSVSSETRIKVLQAMRELGYVPSRAARALRYPLRDGTHILALSAPAHDDTDYTNWSAFFLAVAQRSRQHGYEVLLLMDNEHINDHLMHISDSGLVDGVLLLDVDADDVRVATARNLMVPVVSIGMPNVVSDVYAIDLDFERIGKDVVTNAYRLGHRHLLHVRNAIDLFEEQTGVTVEFEQRTFDQIRQNASQILNSDEAPDVMEYNKGSATAGLLSSQGFLTNLNDYVDEYGWDEIITGSLATTGLYDEQGVMGSGDWYGITNYGEDVMMYYNVDMFDEYGIDIPATA